MQISFGSCFFNLEAGRIEISFKTNSIQPIHPLCLIFKAHNNPPCSYMKIVKRTTQRCQQNDLPKVNSSTRCSDQWFLISKTCPKAACNSNWQYTKQLSPSISLLPKWLDILNKAGCHSKSPLLKKVTM